MSTAPQRQAPEHIHQATQQLKRIFWTMLVLSVISVIVRFTVAGGSQSVFALAVDDLLEILSAIAMLLVLALENRPRTGRFPFGYQRVGSLAGATLAFLVTLAALYIIWHAARALLTGPTPITGTTSIFGFSFWRGWLLIAVAVVTSLPSLWAYRAERPLGKEMEWDELGTHTTSHVVSLLDMGAAVVGIVLARFGFNWGDPAAALVVGLMILRDGGGELRSGAAQLIDQAPQPKAIDRLDAVVTEKPYVHQHRWILRRAGRFINGILFVAGPNASMEDVNRWRAELQRDLRNAEWRLDDLIIAFGTDLPDWLPPPPARSKHDQRHRAREAVR